MLDSLQKDDELLSNIRARWSELAGLLEEINSHWVYEDIVYCFYHQSFNVYALQSEIKRIVAALQSVAPKATTFSPMFEAIYQPGASDKPFEIKHNQQWTLHTR